MIEIGPEHNLNYRSEILKPLFAKIRSAESTSIVGAASMGKTRLLDFMTRSDVRQHYLQEADADMLFLRVDCNRIHEMSDWGFFELLLMVVSQSCSQRPKAALLRPQIFDLQAQVISEKNSLMALRFFEFAVHLLCAENGLNLCFLLDEFDEPYRALPKNTLANLRAIRDDNKNRISFHLFLRNLPERLRPPEDCEGFYELYSRSALGLGPYNREDSQVILQQWEARRHHSLTPAQKEWVIATGTGHPGLMQALFGVLQDHGSAEIPAVDALLLQETNVHEECRKLWEGLLVEERAGVTGLSAGRPVEPDAIRLLSLKRLIRPEGDRWVIFSPLFALYLETVVLPAQLAAKKRVRVDRKSHTVFIEDFAVTNLSKLSFELLDFLEQHCDQVVPRDQIIRHLYGDSGASAADYRLDNLVSRVRQEIEPDPQNPRYLITQFGVGFRLNCD